MDKFKLWAALRFGKTVDEILLVEVIDSPGTCDCSTPPGFKEIDFSSNTALVVQFTDKTWVKEEFDDLGQFINQFAELIGAVSIKRPER